MGESGKENGVGGGRENRVAGGRENRVAGQEKKPAKQHYYKKESMLIRWKFTLRSLIEKVVNV